MLRSSGNFTPELEKRHYHTPYPAGSAVFVALCPAGMDFSA